MKQQMPQNPPTPPGVERVGACVHPASTTRYPLSAIHHQSNHAANQPTNLPTDHPTDPGQSPAIILPRFLASWLLASDGFVCRDPWRIDWGGPCCMFKIGQSPTIMLPRFLASALPASNTNANLWLKLCKNNALLNLQTLCSANTVPVQQIQCLERRAHSYSLRLLSILAIHPQLQSPMQACKNEQQSSSPVF